jgi:FkbM family methyltransferase
MAFVIHALRPGDLFLDLGANVGGYTVLASAVAAAKSISCEPIESTFERLERNIRLNRIESLTDPRRVAVGATAGTRRVIADSDTTNRVAPPEYAGKTADVPVATVDSLLQSVSHEAPFILWKADLEGHEAAMLQGASESLGAGVPHAILLESNSDEVTSILERHKFLPAEYDPFDRRVAVRGNEARQNYLWIRDGSFKVVQERVAEAPKFCVQGVSV